MSDCGLGMVAFGNRQTWGQSRWVPLQNLDRLFAVTYPNNEKYPQFEKNASVLYSVGIVTKQQNR